MGREERKGLVSVPGCQVRSLLGTYLICANRAPQALDPEASAWYTCLDCFFCLVCSFFSFTLCFFLSCLDTRTNLSWELLPLSLSQPGGQAPSSHLYSAIHFSPPQYFHPHSYQSFTYHVSACPRGLGARLKVTGTLGFLQCQVVYSLVREEDTKNKYLPDSGYLEESRCYTNVQERVVCGTGDWKKFGMVSQEGMLKLKSKT